MKSTVGTETAVNDPLAGMVWRALELKREPAGNRLPAQARPAFMFSAEEQEGSDERGRVALRRPSQGDS